MPSNITHYLFAEEVRPLLGESWKNTLEKNPCVYSLGAQGPDFLSYHRFLPWQGKSPLHEVDERIHRGANSAFFEGMLACGSEEGERALLGAYLAGFLCHYALDMTAHPFIFSMQSIILRGEKLPPEYATAVHRRVETALDLITLRRSRGELPGKLKMAATIALDAGEREVLAQAVAHGVACLTGERYPQALFDEAMRDMKRAFALFGDPTGLIRHAARFIEKRRGMPPELSAMFPTDVESDEFDYANALAEQWEDAFDGGSLHSETFFELYDAAKQRAAQMIDGLGAVLAGEEKFSNLTGDVSLSTGRPPRDSE
ncbi:zinc dependent phospholipase C family protein [Feifania hominis]|uniref:Zinc dependent phospholipase C family protein n=1 Tax=Feifania hominis TaxID=2763660 RepID=A0A926DFK2_9FIRM|nr:zinc dependent phospholipase C family protein [Feifania hominis]MBC8536917.1 zinc dependent phospholipase C family protein [Feifania hominis]